MVPVVFVTWLMVVLVIGLVSYVAAKVTKTYGASLSFSSRRQGQKYEEALE